MNKSVALMLDHGQRTSFITSDEIILQASVLSKNTQIMLRIFLCGSLGATHRAGWITLHGGSLASEDPM